jgi:hypothetical protein
MARARRTKKTNPYRPAFPQWEQEGGGGSSTGCGGTPYQECSPDGTCGCNNGVVMGCSGDQQCTDFDGNIITSGCGMCHGLKRGGRINNNNNRRSEMARGGGVRSAPPRRGGRPAPRGRQMARGGRPAPRGRQMARGGRGRSMAGGGNVGGYNYGNNGCQMWTGQIDCNAKPGCSWNYDDSCCH